MSKPKIPNQRNEYKKLNARLNKYVLQVEDIYTAITEQAAQMATRVGYEGDAEFRFSDYPQIKAQVDALAANYVADMENLIYAGTSAEWANSNLVQDLLVNKVLKAYNAQVSGEKYKVYYDPNSEHLRAFQTRRDRGMNLSQRLWNQSSDILTELEETISTAIQKGMSAVTLSKRISKYLQDFPNMQKDYTKRYGKATRSYDCEYRSIRLARSEINMAYRSSENERWRKLDFVVGYEIKVSHKHRVPDICDDLAGKYPKDFEWVGWHPNCTDYKIPILKTEDEFFSVDSKPSVNEVKDVPDSFKHWVRDNQASIKRSEARGTTPYFVRDNRKLVDGLMKSKSSVSDAAYKYAPSIVSAKPKVETPEVFKMDSSKAQKLQVNGFKLIGFGDDVTKAYETSHMKGFDVVSFDRLIEGICDQYEIKLYRKALSKYPNGGVIMTYEGMTKAGDGFDLVRNFIEVDGNRVVEHQVFSLPEEMQGKGLSKKIFRELFSQYEAMGIDEVWVRANMSVGGYTWGKYGFSTDKMTARNIVEEAFDNLDIDEDAFNELMGYIEDYTGDRFPMNLIAEKPYGKDVLLGQHWDGYFSLKDKNQMGVLKEYIGF